MKTHLSLSLALSLCLLSLRASAQVTELHSFTNLNMSIPDGNWFGLSDTRSITSSIARLDALRLKLEVKGDYNGDLYCYVRHASNVRTDFCVLLNRVGRSSIQTRGYADAGLDVEFDENSTNNIHLYQTLSIPLPSTPLRGLWQPDGRNINPAAVLDTTPVETSLSSFHGVEASGTWTLFLADVDMGATHMLARWELEFIGAVKPVITWVPPADITYGSALDTKQLNASSGSVLGTFSYQPPAGTLLDAGSHTLTAMFTPTDHTTYLPVTTSVDLNVLQKELTITAEDKTKVYGAALPTLTASYEGFVNGDTVADLDTPVSLATTAAESSPAGSYLITAAGAVDANYTMRFVNGTLTIAKAATIGILSVTRNPVKPGEPFILDFNLRAVAPGAGTPTGFAQFFLSGRPLSPLEPLSGALARYGTSIFAAGSYSISAVYTGDNNFLGITNSLTPALLVNTAPIAVADSILRSGTNGVDVAISTLLKNDLDPDGDVIMFVEASAIGTNNGTIIRAGDWLHYTPPAGSTNTDLFTYTISDGHGAPVVGSVTVAVVTAPVPRPNLAIAVQANSSYVLWFDGIPGLTYRIEYRDSLTNQNWGLLGTGTADVTGLFRFVDTPPQHAATRYYRAVHP